jgi:hypothetical protein
VSRTSTASGSPGRPAVLSCGRVVSSGGTLAAIFDVGGLGDGGSVPTEE